MIPRRNQQATERSERGIGLQTAMSGVVTPITFLNHRQLTGARIRNSLFSHRLSVAKNLYKQDLFAHYGCVNAIEFSAEGEFLVSGGDDRRVLLWSVPEAIHGTSNRYPISMATNHDSNIFCLSFDSRNARIFSGGNDDQVLVHEVQTQRLLLKLPHKKPVYGLSVSPMNDSIIATAGDDGRLIIYDIRDPVEQCLAKHKAGFHSVMYNPLNASLLVAANSDDGILLFDARQPKDCLIHYDKEAGHISGISACFNAAGVRVLALRRRLPPVLYATNQSNALCQFYHPAYYNSCTMKTCSFAGEDDEYVLSGSDDFNLYMWDVPPDGCEWGQSHLVLNGHRSIVNQVRYNRQNNLIASSGVEKMIKLWSSMPIGNWNGGLTKESSETQRIVYSHEEYMSLIGPGGQRISHDYSDHSMTEDARMMAFFDSLIQREIEGWQSMSEATFTSDSDSDTHTQERIRLSWQSLSRCRKQADEQTKKLRPNRISQLIAHKRNRLAKMALWKSSTLVQRNFNREKHKKRKVALKSLCKWTSRKSKRPRDASPTTTNNSEKENLTRNKRARHKKTSKNFRATRTDHHHHHDLHSIDVPSTSTGITAATSSASAVFRLVEQDSDEEPMQQQVHCDSARVLPPVENLVSIVPTPLNGSQDMYINVLEVTNTNVTSNVVTSTSSSLSESDYEMMVTPAKKRHRNDVEIDSGFGTAPGSSAGSKQRHRRHQCDSSDDEYNYEKFRKRVKKARVNLRKQIGADSDSN